MHDFWGRLIQWNAYGAENTDKLHTFRLPYQCVFVRARAQVKTIFALTGALCFLYSQPCMTDIFLQYLRAHVSSHPFP